MFERQTMNIAFVGHVDHGKSTVVGRLLADTDSLPEGKLDQVKKFCAHNSKPFEYAFLIDALKDEQAQGITIDSARVFFNTKKRDYIIIDAPGHIEFLKNMVTGASRAEAAFLVIDALEGVQENSRRHGYLLSMLGISQVAVIVNKMDLVDYGRERFEEIVGEYGEFLKSIHLEAQCFVPGSATQGENIVSSKQAMPWYRGKTVLRVLDEFKSKHLKSTLPLRMPVQDVYKFTKFKDDRRIIAGTVMTGGLKAGDRVEFYPSGKKSEIKAIERFSSPESREVGAGYAAGVTLKEQIYITRGSVMVKENEQRPHVSTRFKANLFWLGTQPFIRQKEYFLKLGTAKVPVCLESIERMIDATNLRCYEDKEKVEQFDVAEVVLRCGKALSFDTAEDIPLTSRFCIVDQYEISGGGIVTQALEDKQERLRENIFLRNAKWIRSSMTADQRAERYRQRSTLILISGTKKEERKNLARLLEQSLFDDGRMVYFLGIGSVIYGIDADIREQGDALEEHLRRLAEVAHLLLDAGIILIVTARELMQEDFEIIKTTVMPDQIETVWIGGHHKPDMDCDLILPSGGDVHKAIIEIKRMLIEKGIIFSDKNS